MICFVALLATLGAHWPLLQSIAWARMLAQYSASNSLREAVGKTFDGKHPCSLCLQIRHGRQQEQREQPRTPSLRTEPTLQLFFEDRAVSAPPAVLLATDAVPLSSLPLTGFEPTPLKPPPRS